MIKLASAAFAGLLALTACATTSPTRQAVERLERRIRAGEFGNVHAIIAEQHGARVGEYYFAGADERRGQQLGGITSTADTLHDARSVTKTVVGLLFGIAMAEHPDRLNLDQPVLDHFPEFADLRTPERMRIRVRHLLTMTSGFAWDEDTLPYQDPRNSERMMDAAPNAYRYVLSQPIAHAPGERFQYSGGDVMVIARIIERVTGEPLDAYAERVLFRPLGITETEWLQNSAGTPIAASGLRLRPNDMMQIGQLILNHGQSNNQQIVPRAWMDEMTTSHASVTPPGAPCPVRYGYFTWLPNICAEGRPAEPVIAAIGYGGQRIYVFPERFAVVAITAGDYASPQQRAHASALLGAVAAALDPPHQ